MAKTAKVAAKAKSASARAADAIAALKRHGSAKVLAEMGPRYGVVAKKAFGTPIAKILGVAKKVGVDHDVAAALWSSGWYEARLLASMVDDPARVTGAQMDKWRRDFDNWGVCDTVCFKLFDRTPHAFAKVTQWATLRDEFGKRAAFALLASLALHRKDASDADFLRCLPLIERAASDERNFVKKGVSWALRAIGLRKSVVLKREALALAKKLSASDDAAARWVGKDAVRDLGKR